MRECSPPQTCHVSRGVTCHMSHFFFFGQSGEAYRWRVCYQQGLPRLVIRRYSPLQGPTIALALKTQLVPDVENKNTKLDTRKSFHYQGQNGSS